MEKVLGVAEVTHTWGIATRSGDIMCYNIAREEALKIVGDDPALQVVPVSTKKLRPDARQLDGAKIHSIHGTMEPVRATC